ncbi:MAG: hypothetical protein F4X82_00015 [Candidatus Spechtbacteria bacterium SB0662_bin_43]|uniref:Uncharacterized protein n=1 Tax=Candidatus Spechtbacteria bacterium SB0662_bin_43 TaxID=2604897 RepID=A0A845DA34_9BACT|nr:hypothetical protein [Candidatus Spechtbacteria bacterium SB0662_bin_43]
MMTMSDASITSLNQYADEEVESRYTYPSQHQGPKPTSGQIRVIAEIFGLDSASALEYTANLPELPEGAEGWFAIPSVSALARVHFPEVDNPAEQYCQALQLVFEKIAESRRFANWREGFIGPKHLRVHAHTQSALDEIEANQLGDILVIPAQLGMRHRGRSVRRARECFAGNEFGLTSLAAGSIFLTHPERFAFRGNLLMDCPGDEFNRPGSGVRFDDAPIFSLRGDMVGFDTRWLGHAVGRFGSVSGFVPQ